MDVEKEMDIPKIKESDYKVMLKGLKSQLEDTVPSEYWNNLSIKDNDNKRLTLTCIKHIKSMSSK
jgi:hypothetical protein